MEGKTFAKTIRELQEERWNKLFLLKRRILLIATTLLIAFFVGYIGFILGGNI